MKRVLPIVVILVAGCIVQSFHPFYTEKSKVVLPQLNGEWDAVKLWGDAVKETNILPWQISTNQIVAYNGESGPAPIRVAFFKLGGQLFCDSTAGDNDKMSSSYWTWHLRPVHTVSKVETNRDLLTFRPLDLDWLTNLIATGTVLLPHVSRIEDDHWPLFTATPADWEAFLAAYASDTNAFPDMHIFVLKRHVDIPKKESPGR
jgi:hypothetical protein